MSWWDRIVDWGAEAIGYADEWEAGEIIEAGTQLSADVSDTFGFIKQGAKAYGMLTGSIGPDGKRVVGAQQPFKQVQMPQARSYRQMGFGRTTPQFQASQVNMAVGANNPNIQTALAALMNASYNTQMNNVVSQFTVSPTIGQGRKTAVGTTTLQRSQKTRTA